MLSKYLNLIKYLKFYFYIVKYLPQKDIKESQKEENIMC